MVNVCFEGSFPPLKLLPHPQPKKFYAKKKGPTKPRMEAYREPAPKDFDFKETPEPSLATRSEQESSVLIQ